MKLVSFERNGRPGFGVVVGDGIVDAADRLAGRPRSLREALAAGALPLLERLAVMKPDFRQTDVTFTPVIPDAAAKLLCIGVNYLPHIKEMGRERPDRPVVFVRFGDSIVGHGQPLLKPRESEQFDFEGELAVIIGKRARRVAKEQALEYVAGYSCFNDGSLRDFQRHSGQFTPGKNFHASGALGPWLMTADEIPDPRKLTLTTRLERRGHAARKHRRAVLRRTAAHRVLLYLDAARARRRHRDRHAGRRRRRSQTARLDEPWRHDRDRDHPYRHAAQPGDRGSRQLMR